MSDLKYESLLPEIRAIKIRTSINYQHQFFWNSTHADFQLL